MTIGYQTSLLGGLFPHIVETVGGVVETVHSLLNCEVPDFIADFVNPLLNMLVTKTADAILRAIFGDSIGE